MQAFFIFGAKYAILIPCLAFIWVFFKAQKMEKRRMFAFFTASFVLTLALSLVASKLYFNPRPFAIEGFKPLIPHIPDNGFPSDHTLLASAIAAGLMFFRKRLSLLLWIVAVFIGVSRIYVGVHHAIDIAGSIIIALISAGIVHVFLTRRENATMEKITKK